MAAVATIGKTSRFFEAARLALPLVVFFLVQNAVSLVSLAIIGKVGTTSLAAVGIANAVFGTLIALLFGIDTGTQALVSRATGAGDTLRAATVLREAMLASVPLGIGLSALAWFAAPALVGLLTPDTAVAAIGASWLRAAAPSLLLFSLTIPCNAYWIASGRPTISFTVTLVLALPQIALTLLLVPGFGLVPSFGAAGAGMAMSGSGLLGLALQMLLLRRMAPDVFRATPGFQGARTIARIGWPISLQQSFAQLGLVVAFGIVSQLGAASGAMLNVLSSLMMLPIQVSAGLGGAAATLVGQALGRRDAQDAARWGWQMALAAAFLLLPFGIVAAVEPQAILALFISDPATRTMAEFPARLLGSTLAFDTFGRILNFAMRGTGATRVASAIPFVLLWFVQLPLMYVFAIRLGGGFDSVVALQAAIAVFEAGAFAFVWQRGRWKVLHPDTMTRTTTSTVASANRIAILGGAGAGKSTVARALGEPTGLPVFHLDRFVFGPGWTRRPLADVRSELEAALGDGGWIVEGTYPELADLTVARADMVIWIQQPVLRRLVRTWRKVTSGAPRSDRPEDCDESFGWRYVRTIFSFGRFTGTVRQRLAEIAPGRVALLKGDRAVRRFLAEFETNR